MHKGTQGVAEQKKCRAVWRAPVHAFGRAALIMGCDLVDTCVLGLQW